MWSLDAPHDSDKPLPLAATLSPDGIVGACVSELPPVVVTSSCGAVTPVSRLATYRLPLSGVVRAKSTVPLPVTSGVTSMETQVPAESGGDEATTVEGKAGAFVQVRVDSSQLWSVS